MTGRFMHEMKHLELEISSPAQNSCTVNPPIKSVGKESTTDL